MVLAVVGGVFLMTAAVYAIVMRLATGDRARVFKSVSPGMLPPLGIIFGLFVAFIAAQVWNDIDRATMAVNREASALRGVVLLSRAFPPDVDARLRGLVAQHIRDARDVEWPAMAQHRATITMVSTPLSDALATVVALPTTSAGQIAAQREIVTQLETAFDARRQRILLSRGGVDWIKWTALVLQAVLTLVAIVMVHSDDRATAKIALGLFSAAIAVCIVLVVAHDRPFAGSVAVSPSPLLQVQPDAGAPQ